MILTIKKKRGSFLPLAILFFSFLLILEVNSYCRVLFHEFFYPKNIFSFLGKGKYQLEIITSVWRKDNIFYLYDRKNDKTLFWDIKTNQVIKEKKGKLKKNEKNESRSEFILKKEGRNIIKLIFKDLTLRIKSNVPIIYAGKEYIVLKDKRGFSFNYVNRHRVYKEYFNFLVRKKKYLKAISFAKEKNIKVHRSLKMRIEGKIISKETSQKRKFLYYKYNLQNTNFARRVFQKEKENRKRFYLLSKIISLSLLVLSLSLYFFLKR